MLTKYWLKYLAIAISLTTGSIFIYVVLQIKNTPQPPIQTPPIISKVSALGHLEPKGEITRLSAPVSTGNRVLEVKVKEGDQVTKGQVIAILDTHFRAQAVLEKAQTDVEIAQARLTQIKAGAKTGEIDAQRARIENLKAELRGQIAAGEAKIQGLEAQLQGEIDAETVTIERLKAEWNNAKIECDRLQNLYLQGVVTAQERDKTCLNQETFHKRILEAEVILKRLKNSGQKQLTETQETLQLTINTLKEQQAEAIATLKSISEVRNVDVELAEAELNSAIAAAKIAQADLDLSYIKSPIDGEVLKVHVRSGEVIGQNGIADIGQTDQMYVVTEVYETDISQVRIGQKATITSGAFSGELTGEVTFIGLEVRKQNVFGINPQANTDNKVVEVKIRLTPEDSKKVAALSNLQVEVIIEL